MRLDLFKIQNEMNQIKSLGKNVISVLALMALSIVIAFNEDLQSSYIRRNDKSPEIDHHTDIHIQTLRNALQ